VRCLGSEEPAPPRHAQPGSPRWKGMRGALIFPANRLTMSVGGSTSTGTTVADGLARVGVIKTGKFTRTVMFLEAAAYMGSSSSS